MKPKQLILIRGASGSGKSDLAETFRPLTNAIFAADDFFTDEDGNYNFDATMVRSAHSLCRANVCDSMIEDQELIVVHNTFTREWEMKEYFDMADFYSYRVVTMIVENRHMSNNVHGVPEPTVKRQRMNIAANLCL